MQLFGVLETNRCWDITRKRRTSSLLAAWAQQSHHNINHHLCSSKVPAVWVEGPLPAAASSPGTPVHPCLACCVRMALCGPPASPLPHPGWGQGLGWAGSPLVAAAGGRGALSTAGRGSGACAAPGRGYKSALLMGSGLNQPNWAGVVSMELVLLLFILCLINGKINKPPPWTESRNVRNWATPK